MVRAFTLYFPYVLAQLLILPNELDCTGDLPPGQLLRCWPPEFSSSPTARSPQRSPTHSHRNCAWAVHSPYKRVFILKLPWLPGPVDVSNSGPGHCPGYFLPVLNLDIRTAIWPNDNGAEIIPREVKPKQHPWRKPRRLSRRHWKWRDSEDTKRVWHIATFSPATRNATAAAVRRHMPPLAHIAPDVSNGIFLS